MSHVDSLSPAGPLTATPGQVITFTLGVSGVPADSSYTVTGVGSDGVPATVTVNVDRPDVQVLLGGSGTLAANQVRVTSSGGTVAAVAGQPLQFTWTAP